MYYYEQPSVKFEDQMLIFLNYNGDEKFFSTIYKLNSVYKGGDNTNDNNNNNPLLDFPPIIKFEMFDYNNDGLNDTFKFKINIPVDDVKNIKNIKLVFLFNYEVNINIVGRMDTIGVVDVDTPLGVSYMKIDGDLNLLQKSAIDRTTFYNEYYYENIFNKKDANNVNYHDLEAFSFKEICENYYSRNFTTYFDYETYIEPMRNPTIAKFDVTINIPSFQKILYMTPAFTKFKFFFVQLVAVMIPVIFILYAIMQFVFRNQVIQTTCSNNLEIPKKKIL